MKTFFMLAAFLYISAMILGYADRPDSRNHEGNLTTGGGIGLIVILLFVFVILFTLVQFATPH